jgi:transcription initiation factor IIE alpha subunit
MTKRKYEEMANLVPFEIRNTVRALNNDVAWAILNCLLEHDKLSRREIIDLLEDADENEVDKQMKCLISSGLIDRRCQYFKDLGIEEKAWYQPTEIAKTTITALMDYLLMRPAERFGAIHRKE